MELWGFEGCQFFTLCPWNFLEVASPQPLPPPPPPATPAAAPPPQPPVPPPAAKPPAPPAAKDAAPTPVPKAGPAVAPSLPPGVDQKNSYTLFYSNEADPAKDTKAFAMPGVFKSYGPEGVEDGLDRKEEVAQIQQEDEKVRSNHKDAVAGRKVFVKYYGPDGAEHMTQLTMLNGLSESSEVDNKKETGSNPFSNPTEYKAHLEAKLKEISDESKKLESLIEELKRAIENGWGWDYIEVVFDLLAALAKSRVLSTTTIVTSVTLAVNDSIAKLEERMLKAAELNTQKGHAEANRIRLEVDKLKAGLEAWRGLMQSMTSYGEDAVTLDRQARAGMGGIKYAERAPAR